jgi:hypothetical protein
MTTFIFECLRIYEEKETEKYTTMITAPAECTNEGTQRTSWKLWFRRWFSSEHPCAAYNRAVKVTTITQINPSIVLMDLISRFISHPLVHAGSALGQFTYQFLSQLPWVLQYSFPFLTLIFLFVYFFAGVLHINMPYGLGSINIRR